MNIDEVKAMTDEELWHKIQHYVKTWTLFHETAATELRADIERRGMQEHFERTLYTIVLGGYPYSTIVNCSFSISDKLQLPTHYQNIPHGALFALCNASPRQVAEAYLMTVEEL